VLKIVAIEAKLTAETARADGAGREAYGLIELGDGPAAGRGPRRDRSRQVAGRAGRRPCAAGGSP
jgi:hypothetical protein